MPTTINLILFLGFLFLTVAYGIALIKGVNA